MTIKNRLLAHLRTLAPDQPTTTPALAAALDCSAGSVAQALQALTAAGRVKVTSRQYGPGGGSTYEVAEAR